MPIQTTTCRIDGENDNGDGSSTIALTWGYSDETNFSDVATVPTYDDHEELEAHLRSLVAGPNGEEKALTFTYPEAIP